MYESIIDKKEKSLKDEFKELKEYLQERDSKKPRGFKLPMKAKINKMNQKNNYATVLKINENGSVDFTKEKIEDQTIVVDGIPRLTTGEDVLNYKGKPLIILPSWSVKPFSPSDNFNKSLSDGSNNVGYRILLNKIKSGTISAKKKFSLGLGIGLLVLVGIIIYAIAS